MNDNLIQSMTTSLEELLRRLNADRDRIQAEINRVKGDLAALKAGSPETLEPNKRRRPRGANERAIRNLFDSNDTLDLSLADIVDRTEIPSSSVGAVIKKLVAKNIIEQTLTGTYQKTVKSTSEEQ